jgi:hypothetical protein
MPEEGTSATRRTVLRTGLLALGGLAGIVGAGGLAARMKSGLVPSPSEVSAGSFRLWGTEWSLAAPGLRRGDLPKRGDLVSVSGVLRAQPDGEPVGDFFASVVHLDGTAGHGPYSSVQQETHTFRLADGTIVGMGTNLPSGESVFAIVGGTGRYSGVTGSYIGTQSPLEIGGDGMAEFTFTIKSGR